MARPKKPRLVDGVALVDNLYRDPNGRAGYYRYVSPRGQRIFAAATVEEANRLATEANAERDRVPITSPPAKQRGSWADLVARHIAARERQDPSLADKHNWHNRRYALQQFATHFKTTPVGKITRRQIARWWNTLSHNQQGSRHSELRRFFNFIMGEGYCQQLEYNPFTLSDDRPRLYRKAKPEKVRSPLDEKTFWLIYERAGKRGYHGLQNAMIISLLTSLRQGDLLKMRFDQIVDNQLRVVVGKSEKQRGAASAARLEWDLDEYPILAATIRRARETSLAHRRCPYVIHHKGQRVNPSKVKTHPYQMLKRAFAEQFAECRPDIPNPTTFHEIRALSSVLYCQNGFSLPDIKTLMAHTDEATTRGYQDHGDLPFTKIHMVLTEGDIGGKF